MSLTIDRNKLKIKHFLDIQQETVGYPSLEDFLYELVNVLIEHDMLESDFGVLFTKARICTSISKEAQEEFYDELLRIGYIRVNEESLTKSKYPSYRLVKHPWLKD